MLVYKYIPLQSYSLIKKMKSSELHRLVVQNGWELERVSGSHYIYKKGDRTYPVPYHGSKEVGKGIEKKIKKEMELV